ncbi:MAG: hypothetical protein R3348_04545 [Xanthomonadales bacterium]|nr:hypothetical protein [Xanthomonadales bacterium]
MHDMICRVVLASALLAPAAWAGNTTISDAFVGTEPTMTGSAVGCSPVARPYRAFATIQVSASGMYRFFDAGHASFILGESGDVADIVVLIYNGAFDPASPWVGRIAQIDETQSVSLSSGTNYILVAQHACERETYRTLPFGVVITGAGDVTGAGFNSATNTFGVFEPASPTAFFPGTNGFHAFAETGPFTMPVTGNYFFSDVGYLTGSEVELWVYDGAFNPGDVLQNFVAKATFAQEILLEAGVSYRFVIVDVADILDSWQFALFPPGEPIFNPGLNTAWVADGIGAQGIIAEVLPQARLMFFAWFTYVDSPAVIASVKGGVTPQADSVGARPEGHLGSSDQRWLTGFGFLPSSGQFININFENSTGGAFDSTLSSPSTDSLYGLGTIQLLDCNTMILNYNLPDGLTNSRTLRRIVPDGVERCYDLTPQAPIQPPLL